MKMKHVLLEMYCSLKSDNEKPTYCEGVGHICIHNKCEYMGCTYCPNEIAYANEHGVVEDELDFVGFGGDMNGNDDNKTKELIEKWNKICRKKIDEAYEEYMDYRNS
ncbi:hypothetical protein FDE76_07190 [Clostridium botulinum]|uniref:Erythrocyte membrane protein 1 n=1 Tax=Clostridium botulinum (strain Eklund 17B / Type B) TaxID=935198 RepID=B2TIQ4_CLOBB|nr:hypothetical protein [Clostridium sp. ZBS4]ACD24110.1 putative erythrocyte membrane protein 1 [Clostridium botulinum B str. Eklund 17B (NRP)]MBY6977525.1 hypothetical protein [Clostridium botulinum]MBY7001770.1 hypothetical protein [Clostridium botulinum]MCR1275454.1 hypothetical protein [Clostridium botulinum]NFD70902.1 hypothetical protein [Clostridium botulinum]